MIGGFAPIGVLEHWSDDVMETEEKDLHSAYSPVLQHSITPCLS
jgi:hypothetical protein